MNLDTQKKALRKNMLAARKAAWDELGLSASHAIVASICKLPAYQQAKTVLGYMNFGSEFASELWVVRALTDGKRLVLPKVNRLTNQLELYWVDNLATQLEVGAWNIREPSAQRCEPLNNPNEVEFALVPGVAFCRDGSRLGYGGGFYDKLLARFTRRPTLVSAAFALQIVPEIPQETTDIKVEWIVTEQEVIACSL